MPSAVRCRPREIAFLGGEPLGEQREVLRHAKDDTLVYKQFVENESFRRSVSDIVYALTSEG